MNLVNGARTAKKMGLKLITLTGHKSTNPLRKIGNVNLWIDCKNYNIIEMTHHIWLLSLVDYLAKSKNF